MARTRSPSREEAQRHLTELQGALDAVRGGKRPLAEVVVWPPGLDRSVLLKLPLRTRTRNCLLAAGVLEGDRPLTVHQLMVLPAFGQKSLTDLLHRLESFLDDCARTGPAEPQDGDLDETRPEEPSESWRDAMRLLKPVLAAAAELHGVESLADALSPEVQRLAERMGCADAMRMLGIEQVAEGTLGLVAASWGRLVPVVDAVSRTERAILTQRLLGTPPATLAAIGRQVGVTRERIRQIQARLERKLRTALGSEPGVVAATLKGQVGHVAEQDAVERRIQEIVPTGHEAAARVLRKELIEQMGFTLDRGMYLDERATAELAEIWASIRERADDAGLMDEQAVIDSLPGDVWRRFWPWVRERHGLSYVLGYLGIRNSGRARVKAALMGIGRPATRAEITRACGFDSANTGAHLSATRSIVRADKDHWALKDWVDEEYDGIAGEIIQRIEEDGGATTTERLLTELPAKFGVSPVSVRAYMLTRKFVVRDGKIRLANASALRLRDLDDAIDGRDAAGAPYWTFPVRSRLFEGYGVAGVPAEFAKAIGCAPDGSERVRIENLAGDLELSVRWPLASTIGASLGNLAEPLRQLGVAPGQRARVTIKGHLLVELGADESDEIAVRRKRRRRRRT